MERTTNRNCFAIDFFSLFVFLYFWWGKTIVKIFPIFIRLLIKNRITLHLALLIIIINYYWKRKYGTKCVRDHAQYQSILTLFFLIRFDFETHFYINFRCSLMRRRWFTFIIPIWVRHFKIPIRSKFKYDRWSLFHPLHESLIVAKIYDSIWY